MADTQSLFKKVLTAVYGKDVRQSIHDLIKTCYEELYSMATVKVSTKEPTETTNCLWINPEGNDNEFSVPEIKDDEINIDDTWSSSRLYNMFSELGKIEVTWIPGCYINSSGKETAHSEYNATDYIPIVVGGVYKCIMYELSLSKNTKIALYDELKNVIEVIAPSESDRVETILGHINYVENTRYVRFSNYAEYSPKLFVGNLHDARLANGGVTADMMAKNSITPDKCSFMQHDNKSNFIESWKKYCYINTGKETSHASFYASSKVYLDEGVEYYYGNLYGGYYAFYDKDDNVLEYHNIDDPPPKPFTVPAGTVYGRFTITKDSQVDTAWISTVDGQPDKYRLYLSPDSLPDYGVGTYCDYSGDDISAFTKCICIGDSLTSGTMNYVDENGSTGNYVSISKYSFPSNLKRLTGLEVTNLGSGGATSSEWYTKYKDVNLEGHDIAIIQLGVNDAIRHSGWTDTSINGFKNIISKLQKENNNIKIFVSTIVPATSYDTEAMHAVSQGIRDLIATLADEDVILLDMATYGHTKDYAAYNCGHLSAYGYYRLAKDYKSYISYYMNTNKNLFREIQFIGTNLKYES